MRVVVMDRAMEEPLTVVEMPAQFMREAERGHRDWVIPVPTNMAAWSFKIDEIPAQFSTLQTVRLIFEPICRNDEQTGKRRILFWIAVPDNEELALILRAAFLPGQMNELHRREAVAWFNGAISAIGGSHHR